MVDGGGEAGSIVGEGGRTRRGARAGGGGRGGLPLH